MKNLKISSIIIMITTIILLSSCTYKKKGEIVMDKDGNFYELEVATTNESYFLKKIDTTKFKVKGFENCK